jgi:pilus assembly protein CpaD
MRFLHTSAIIGLALSVSACGTQNRGLESVHQPVVSRTHYALDLGAGGDGLSQSDTSRLQSWFESLKLGYGDHIAVDAAGGSSSGAARDAVAGVAARYGLLLDNNAPITEGEVSPGTVRVVVSRSKAVVPGCPDWSRTSDINFNEHNGSNFGCGVNSNLAAMAANPEDLVLGQTADSSIDAATSGKAIKSYRTKKPTGEDPLKAENSRSN